MAKQKVVTFPCKGTLKRTREIVTVKGFAVVAGIAAYDIKHGDGRQVQYRRDAVILHQAEGS